MWIGFRVREEWLQFLGLRNKKMEQIMQPEKKYAEGICQELGFLPQRPIANPLLPVRHKYPDHFLFLPSRPPLGCL